MTVANLKIVMTTHGRGEVFVDGHKVSGVKSFRVTAGVDEANTIDLCIHPETIEIEGEFDVSTIESECREILRGGGG